MLPKILIASPINFRKDYCLDDYFQNLVRLTYPEKDFYFVDNSLTAHFATGKIKKWGFDIDWYDPKGMRNQDYIRDSMNLIRKRFLDGDYTHLAVIECDLFPPHDVIEQLLSWDAQVVCSPYFLGHGAACFLSDTEIEDCFGVKSTNRHMGWMDSFLNFKGDIQTAKQCGLGMSLIRRDVMEPLEFITSHDSPAHHDTWFYYMLHDLGIKILWDTRAIIEHRNQSWTLVADAN